MYTALDSIFLWPEMILGVEIPCKVFNYGVTCHQVQLRLYSALIITVTATTEGLFALLEGCLCLLGAMIIMVHTILAQYFESSIEYMFHFPVEIQLLQSEKNRKAYND